MCMACAWHVYTQVGCSVLLGQMVWYGGAYTPSRLATRKALYAELSPSPYPNSNPNPDPNP